MKNATQYAQKIKKLLNQIKEHAQKDPPVEIEGPSEVLLLGILARTTTEKKAMDALTNLRESTVDLNDLRVTPVAEMVQIVGTSYPGARSVSEEIVQILNSIFNQIHEIDLTFLKTMAKKAAMSFIDGVDGLSPYANAFFRLRWLESTAVPLTDEGLEYLVKTDHLPEGTSMEDAQKFLGNHFKDKDAQTLSAALKIYASSAAARKDMRDGSAPGTSGKKSSKKSKTSKAGSTSKKTTKKAATPKTAGTKKKKTTTSAPKKKRLRR